MIVVNNKYYVYEWIRLDTNEPFYVGKGSGNRWKKLTRGNNKHFNNIVKSIPVAVNILHNNLDEQIAFELEIYYIWLYRDIIGYDMCNINDGGEGDSLPGNRNPMYGKHHTNKTKEKIKEKLSEINSGCNNPFYGKRHTQETREKISKNHADVNGKNNPKSLSVICLTTKKIFFTITSGGKYYNCAINTISLCCKGKRKSSGKLPDGTPLVWRYVKINHNKILRGKDIEKLHKNNQ